MPISPTELRANLYRTLDDIAETGEPMLIERKGRVFRIEVEPMGFDPARLIARPDAITGDAADLCEVSFADAWQADEL